MPSKTDLNRNDDDDVSNAPEVVDIPGQPANAITADGSDSNTVSDGMGDDSASSG